MADDDYVVVLDKELDFCRLFRTDSIDLPAGETLWSGNGLRRGYDAMIRLNKERRPVSLYHVCSSQSPRGRTVYGVVKGEPAGRWTSLSAFPDYVTARKEMKALTAARDAAEAAEREKARAIMRRVGILSKRIPKFTKTDLRYIDWLRRSGRFAA